MAYVFTVAGATKQLQLGWSIRESANGRALFTGAIVSTNASYRPAIGAEVILTESGTRIFGGYIDTPAETGIGGLGIVGIATTISAADYNSLAERRSVIDGGFTTGMTLKQCLTSLVGYLTDYGVAVHSSQVDGPSLAFDLVYDVRTITSILDELSVITGYLWRIDFDKKLRMWAPGDLSAPFDVSTANRFAEGDVQPVKSRTDYANYIIMLAGTGTGEVTDTFTGDGVTTAFTLRYPLSSHRGYVTNGAANEPIGSTAPPYWTYDSATNTITRSSAPANLNAISITYIAQYPVRATSDGGAASADRVEKVIAAPDTFDITVAQALADGWLDRAMAAETQTVRYRTRQVNIHPGQVQTLTFSQRAVSGTFLVTDVTTVNGAGNVVFRDVTAVSGTTYPGSWRDAERMSGGSTGTTVGGVVTVTSGGGVSGIGTAGKLAQWASTNTLADGPTTSTVILSSGSYADPAWITSLAASKLTGNLAYARMPSGSGTWTADPTISGTLSATDIGSNLIPHLTDTYDIGSAFKLWRQAFISQLNAVLFAKETQTLYGGWLAVSKNAGTFPSSVSSAATTVDFGTSMTLNQFVLIRAADNNSGAITSEYMKVGTLVSGTTYNVTRNLSGLGAKDWAAGTPFQVRGVAGDGWVELNAFDTPRMSVFTQGSAYNNSTENIRIGHLSGMPNSSSGIGAYMGDSTNYFRYDSTSLKLVSSTVTIDSTGIALTPDTTGVFANTNAFKFSISNGLLGMSGTERTSPADRTLYLYATDSGSTKNTSVFILASGAGGTKGAQVVASANSSTDGVGITCFTGDVQLTAGTSILLNTATIASSTLTGAGVYSSDGWLYAKVNGGGLKVRNAANSAYLSVVGADASDQVFLDLQGNRLRFSNPATTGTAGAIAGYLQVAIDGVGNKKIPYYDP